MNTTSRFDRQRVLEAIFEAANACKPRAIRWLSAQQTHDYEGGLAKMDDYEIEDLLKQVGLCLEQFDLDEQKQRADRREESDLGHANALTCGGMTTGFLAALGGDFHTFQTFDDTKQNRRSLRKVISNTFANSQAPLFTLNAQGAGIFVTVNQTDGKGRKIKNITKIRAIFADFDGPDAAAKAKAATAKLPPSIVVESSPGRYHLYWLTDGSIDIEHGADIQKGIPAATGSDKNACDVARVLRIPGFHHCKSDPVLVKLLELHPERRYNAEQIIEALGVVPVTKRKRKTASGEADLDHVINESTERDLHSALQYLNVDSQKDWYELACDLGKSDEIGFRLFHEISKRSKGYKDEEDCRVMFERGRIEGCSHYRNVFLKAAAAGWVNPATRRSSTVADGNCTPPLEVPPPEPTTESNELPPGVVGEIARYILESSRMPVPSFAIAGALAAASYMIQNRAYVGPSQTSLNLYCVLLGSTGKGKEDPRKAIKRLVDALNQHSMTDGICETMSSGTALLRTLMTNRNLLMLSDEYGIFMQSAMQNRDDNRRDLVKELMSIYGLGRSFHAGKKYADLKQNIGRIDKPYVVTLGTSTEEEFFAGMNMMAINNGSANRNIYIYADGTAKTNRNPKVDISDALLTKLTSLFNAFAVEEHVALTYGPRAEAMIVEFGENLPTTGNFANLWSRAEENAIRIAGILAFCDGKVIAVEHVRWAIDYVRHSIEFFEQRSETQISEGIFDKQMNKALEIIRNPRRYTDDQKFSAFTRKGKMPRGKLIKLMKLKARDLDEVLEALLLSGQIHGGKEDNVSVYWV